MLQTGQGHTDDSVPAQPLDPPRLNDPPGICKEHDLYQDFRIVRGTASLIMLLLTVNQAEFHLVVDEMMEGGF